MKNYIYIIIFLWATAAGIKSIFFSDATDSFDSSSAPELTNTPTGNNKKEENNNNAPISYQKIDSFELALKFNSNPFEVREKNIGKNYETSIFAEKFIDEGTDARIIDANSGFYCLMKGSEYSKHNKRGVMVVRGTLAEGGTGLGLIDCTFVSNDTEWSAK